MMSRPEIRPAYGKVRDAAIYCSVSERTIRDWLKEGLLHIRVRGGNILIKFSDLDAWMSRWCTCADKACAIVDGLIRELRI